MLNLEKILSAFRDNKARFILIGGQAAVAHGSVYGTWDTDICYARDKGNLENIVKALSPFHPYLRGAPKGLPFIFDAETLKRGLNFTFSTDIGDVDLLGEVKGLGYYDDVLKYSEEMEIYGKKCKVLTIEGLIKNKKEVRREKDVALVKELEALLEIRKQKKKNK